MKTYRKILLSKLVEDGWELTLQEDYTDWWSDGYWEIRSVKNNWGLKVYIHFLVDPQYDGPIKESAVWAVSASRGIPTNRREAGLGISLMVLSKGKFNTHLLEFVSNINNYRNRV